MKRIHTFSFIFAAILWGVSCKEESRTLFVDESQSAPRPVTAYQATGKPGGAIIKFEVPNDEDLSGVKAVYVRNGEVCETKASKYVDTLVVEGLGNTQPLEVKLYSIGHNNKLSQPVSLTVTPLPPPIETVKFDLQATFGGVAISLEHNDSRADLAIVLMADTAGSTNFQEIQSFHTKSPSMQFAKRGIASITTPFAVYLRDRWNNHSDTIYKTLTPIKEVKIPKDQFRNAALPTDYFATAENNSHYRIEQLWSGPEAADGNFFATPFGAPMPQWLTIDLGVKASISRIQKWPRSNYELYSGSAPRVFQVWGSDNPNPDGSWDESWFLIGEFEQLKPSGYGEGREVGPVTDEDSDYWYNRTEFEVLPTATAPDPYRPATHLRIKVLSTYTTYGTEATSGQVIVGEFTFWGQVSE